MIKIDEKKTDQQQNTKLEQVEQAQQKSALEQAVAESFEYSSKFDSGFSHIREGRFDQVEFAPTPTHIFESESSVAENRNALIDEFPAWKPNIEAAEKDGFTIDEIRNELVKRELIERFKNGRSQDEVDVEYGRNPETKTKTMRRERKNRTHAYYNILRDTHTKKQIDEILHVSEITGLSPSILMTSPELFKRAQAEAGRVGTTIDYLAHFVRSIWSGGYQGYLTKRGAEAAWKKEEAEKSTPEPRLVERGRGNFTRMETPKEARRRYESVVEQARRDFAKYKNDAMWFARIESEKDRIRPPDSMTGAFLLSVAESAGFSITSGFISGVSRTIGAIIGGMAAGGPTAGAAAAAGAKFGADVAGVIASLFNTDTEAKMEAGGVLFAKQQEYMAKGMSFDDAFDKAFSELGDAMSEIYLKNIIVLAGSNIAGDYASMGLGSFAKKAGKTATRTALKRMLPYLAGAVFEGVEEAGQEIIRMVAMDEKMDAKMITEAFGVGMGHSLFYTGVGRGAMRIADRFSGKKNDAVSDVANQIADIANAVNNGEMSHEEAFGKLKELAKEVVKADADALNADTPEAESARKYRDEVKSALLARSNMTEEQAQANADIYASYLLAGSKKFGISVDELHRLRIQGETPESATEETLDQRAYHGSPHRGIEKMSLQHIGTGEGNQAYGWGIYSAQDRELGEFYRDGLQQEAFFEGNRRLSGNEAWAVSFLFDENGNRRSIEEAKQEIRERIKPEAADMFIADLERLEPAARLEGSGQLYRLEVPENDVLLDWDKPLSEQPEKVKAAIRRIAKELSPEALAHFGGDTSLLTASENTGNQFYSTLGRLPGMGGEKGASELLLKHGIPGLRYLDGKSRDKGEGTHNFVVWDENAMSVEETYYQLIGQRGAEALDAAEEGTTRLDNLNVAREMERAGKDAKVIRLATGWERGADGKWRHEIPDGTFRREGFISNPDMLELRELEKKFIEGNLTDEEQARLEELKPVVRQIRKPSRLSDFYDAPELYAAYPELADIRVEFQHMGREKKGAYSPARNAITLNTGFRGEDARKALVHEIQHAIQDIEGFARGGDLRNGGERYHHLAGEVEARNAGERTSLSDKERKERLLVETEDVAREDQIILEEMMGAEMAHYQRGEKAEDPVSSKYVRTTERSLNIPVDRLHKTEPLDAEAAARARENMQQAERGEREKRDPLIVADRGDGTFSIIDGNNTFENLKALGAQSVPSVIVPAPYQKHVDSAESLYARNKEAQAEFSELLGAWQGEVGGELVLRPELKDETRVREKVENHYAGKHNRVLDVLAGSLVFDSAEQVEAAFEALKDKAEVVRIKDKWTKPDDETGYRDVNLNVRLSNGVIAELQIQHRGVLEAQNGLGHLLYEFIRSNEKKDEMIPYVNQAKEISRAIYEAGFQGTLSQRLASSMAHSLEIARRLSSIRSAADADILLRELSALTLNTLAPSSSESIAPDSRNSTANGTSSPFSKYRSMENTSTGEKRNDHYNKNVPQEGVKSNGEDGIPPRASIRFDRSTGQAILTLFEAADASSFVHELWHIALDDLIRLGASENASEQAKADRLAALQWLGSTDGKLTAEQHEKWAEAGEAYFKTGKAPTPKLQGVFARMRQWMLDIYGMIRAGQGVEIPEHIQDVFDRILATPEDIDASYEGNTLFGTLAGQNKLLKERVAEIDEQLADTERRIAEVAETGEPPITDVAGEEETYRQSANVNEIIESIRNNEFLHISMEDIAQTYGEDILAMLPEGIVSEDAFRKLDDIAEFFGYEDGGAFIKDLVDGMSDDSFLDAAEQGLSLIEQTMLQDELNAIAESSETSRSNVIDFIKSQGKLSYKKIAEVFGDESTRQLVKHCGPGLFSKDGLGLDEMAQALNSAGLSVDGDDALLAILMKEKSSDDSALQKIQKESFDEGLKEGLARLKEGLARLKEAVVEARAAGREKKAKAVQKVRDTLRARIDDLKIRMTFEKADLKHRYEEKLRKKDAQIRNKSEAVQEIEKKISIIERKIADLSRSVTENAEQAFDVAENIRALEEQRAELETELAFVLKGERADRAAETASEKAVIDDERKMALEKQAVKYEVKLEDERERARDKIDDLKIRSALEKRALKEQLEAKYKKLLQKKEALIKKRKETARLRKEIRTIVRNIMRASKDKKVAWRKHEEIVNLLSRYDLKNRKDEIIDMRIEFELHLALEPGFIESMHPDDISMLGKTPLSLMTISEIRELGAEIKELQREGQVIELERREARQKRVDKMHKELTETLAPHMDEEHGGIARSEDLKKKYKGLKGAAAKVNDWVYAATLNAQRLFDWLDGGMATYKGAFVRYFCDAVNEARDNELRNVFRRREAVEQVLSKLGLSISGMQRKIHVEGVSRRDGQDFTVDQVLSIYCGLKNTKSAKAILFGNLGYYGDNAQAVANALIAQLTEAEKSAGDMIMADYEREFERLNNAFIDAYNQGMEHEENYTPMRRLEYTTSEGLLDADTGEALMNARASAGGLGEVEGGFLISRRDINEEGQRAIDLGLFEIWLGQVDRQEHAAAFAALLSELKSVIASHGQDMKLKNMVTQIYGKTAWKGVISYYNVVARDDLGIAHDVLDKVSTLAARGMSVTYICGNLGTVLKQTSSYPRFLEFAGATHLTSAIGEFTANPKAFLDRVYELDPQLKDRKGNLMLRALHESGKSGKLIDLGMEPIVLMDRMTAAIGWKAVFDANRAKGLSERDSIREAQRAVLLTQQLTHAKDASLIWKTNRFIRLAMIFTSEAAQLWGMSVYDMAQSIRRGSVPAFLAGALALTLTATMYKLMTDGPPDDDDDETWGGWFASALTRQFIESIPLVGREIMVAYDARLGDRRWSGSHYSAFVAPIDKLLYATTHMRDEFGDVNERAIWNILEAAALITGKFPATATRRLWESGKAVMDDDLQFAVMNMLGMKRWMKDRLRY